MLPSDAVATVTNAMSELKLDQDAVDEVRKSLTAVVSTLDGDPFRIMATIQRESFGGNAAATTLAYHHGLAQQVMNETLNGMKADLEALVTNVVKAAEVIKGVDASAGGDLKKRQALIEAFNSLGGSHSHEEHAHTHARNHQHNPWPTQTTDGGQTGAS